MNETNDLIAALSQESAAPRQSTGTRFALPLLGAALFCFAAMAAVLGMPFTGIELVGTSPYATKWAFSLAVAIGGALALHALARPGQPAAMRLNLLATPFALVLLFAVIEAVTHPPEFPGATWQRCVTAILLLSPICFGAAIFAARKLAPTQLRRAGLAAGMFASGIAATAYAPWCPETGAMFLAAFYATPMLLMAFLGWLLGPRLLRW